MIQRYVPCSFAATSAHSQHQQDFWIRKRTRQDLSALFQEFARYKLFVDKSAADIPELVFQDNTNVRVLMKLGDNAFDLGKRGSKLKQFDSGVATRL
jgi:hypothetical protein